MFTNYNIYPCGDHAVTISFGNAIVPDINDKVLTLFETIKSWNFDGVKDVIPAYTTLTVVYDIQKIKEQTTQTAYSFIKERIVAALNDAGVMQTNKSLLEIPVCYNLEFGIDLERMSASQQLSIDKIIEIHTSRTYRVYMLGFLPGFAYMGVVDACIATPRLSTPRTNVAAGSVGIAGDQTGIYPFDSPGGWNIIGRTPLILFDSKKEDPCLFEPGKLVKFISITKEQFEQLKHT